MDSRCGVTASPRDVIALTSSTADRMQSYDPVQGCVADCGDMTSSCVADYYCPSTATTAMLASRSYNLITAAAADGKTAVPDVSVTLSAMLLSMVP